MLQLGFSNICGFNMKSSLVESCLFLLLHIPLLLIFGNLVPSVWCGSPGFPSRANLLQLGQGKLHLANLWAALMGPQGTPSGASSRMQCPWYKPPGEAGAAFGKNLRMSGGHGEQESTGYLWGWKNYHPHSYRCPVSHNLWTNVPASSGRNLHK